MFDVGFQELTLIGIIGLIVIGPQRLPKVARTIGLYVGKLRRFVTDVRTDVERELKAEDLKSTFTDATGLSDFDDVKNIVEETSEEMRKVRESYDATRDELVTAGDDLSADGDEEPPEPAIGRESSGLQTNNQTQDLSDTAEEGDEDWDDEYEDVEDEFEAHDDANLDDDSDATVLDASVAAAGQEKHAQSAISGTTASAAELPAKDDDDDGDTNVPNPALVTRREASGGD